MSILISGGAGYIGSHTAKSLSRAGFEPVVYDNLSTGHRWAVKWGPLIEADLCDQNTLKQALKRYNVTAAIHFAAHAYVGESVLEPRRYFENNVTNSLNLIHALLDAGVNCLVFSSSCAVYGAPQCVPISESHPKLPVNPYGESKLFIERVLQWYGVPTAYAAPRCATLMPLERTRMANSAKRTIRNRTSCLVSSKLQTASSVL